MVAILLLLAVLVGVVTMNRFVLEQKKQIGVLLALGHPPTRILISYLGASIVVGAIASLCGIIVFFIAGQAFTTSFKQFLGAPFMHPAFGFEYLVVCTAAAIFMSMASLFMPLRILLANSPTQIMRSEVQDGLLQASWFRALLSILSVFPLGVRYGIGNMLRKPRLSMLMIFAVAFSISVSIAYAICVSSYNGSMFKSLEFIELVHYCYPGCIFR